MIPFAMEPHPVPQNVTTFEFHLVGDMTLKQFGYLALGLTISYLSFVFLLPVNLYLAIPLIIVPTLAGITFAFLPLYDRPLEHWLMAYLKAIYTPTKRQWQTKNGIRLNPQGPLFKNRLQLYLGISPSPVISPPISLPVAPVLRPTPPHPLAPQPPLPTPPQTPPSSTNMPSPEELNKLVELARQAQLLQVKIIDLEKQINHLRTTPGSLAGGQDPNFEKMVAGLESLVKETEQVGAQTAQIQKRPVSPKNARVVVVEPMKQPKAQVTLTSLPNVINGVVTDETGGYLEGVIVIIHNKEGLPVRALKTNKLGQFTGATPLPDGVYTLTLEKDSLDFDTLQITLSGEVLTPIKVSAKRKAVASP